MNATGALEVVAPAARMWPRVPISPRRAAHMVERGVYVYKRNWLFLCSGFLEPVFYLLSISVGLSHLVGTVQLSGHAIAYTRFVAPGLLATSAMNGSIFDSTFNVFYKLKISKAYDAVIATPVGVRDIALGEVGWALCRGTIYACGFLAAMAALGLVGSWWAVLCLPVASLVSLAFACVGIMTTSYVRTWSDLSGIFIAILPLFLFSGTFFALSAYPRPVALFVEATPLYQGVVVLRALDNGYVSAALLFHVAYLAVLAVVALSLATRRLALLLTP